MDNFFKRSLALVLLSINSTVAWNDHYDEEDDTWVLKVLMPLLGVVIIFCIGGCFYQHHLRKKSELEGTSDKDTEGTDQLPEHLKKASPFGDKTNTNNVAKIGNLNIPQQINPSRNYTQVSPSKIAPSFTRSQPQLQQQQTDNTNYQQIGANYTSMQQQNQPIFSIPRSASCAFATGKGPSNYDFQAPLNVPQHTTNINRSTSVLNPNSNYGLVHPNLPNIKRGQSMSVHGNYLNRPVASFQGNNRAIAQHQQLNESENIYIESGSSESNYSAIDAMNNNIHKKNLLPGLGSTNVNINRRAFRNRYNGRGNGLISKSHSVSQYDLNQRNYTQSPATLSNIDRSTSVRAPTIGSLYPQTNFHNSQSHLIQNDSKIQRSPSFHSELGPPIDINNNPLNNRLKSSSDSTQNSPDLGRQNLMTTSKNVNHGAFAGIAGSMATRSAGNFGSNFRQNGDSGMFTTDTDRSSPNLLAGLSAGRNISDGNQTDTTYVSVGQRSAIKPINPSEKMSSLRRAYSLTDLETKESQGNTTDSQIFSQTSKCSSDQNDQNQNITHTPAAGPFNHVANRPMPQTPVYNNRLVNSNAFTQPTTDPYTKAAQSLYESFTPLHQSQRPTSLINQAPTGNFAYGTNPVRTQSMLTPQNMQNSPFNFQPQPHLNGFPHSQAGSMGQITQQNFGGSHAQMSQFQSPNLSGITTPNMMNVAMTGRTGLNPTQMLQQQLAMKANQQQQRFF